MTAQTLAQELNLACLAGSAGLSRPVSGGYVGDLLSWVMGRAPDGCAWITVMGNANAVAVAVLKDAACIILCENAPLDEDARARAEENHIPVLSSLQPAYPLALKLGEILGGSPEK